MTVRFRDTDPRPLEKVTLRCQESKCAWTKRVAPSVVIASLRGHYGYQHPNLRLPDRRDVERAVEF